MKLLYRSKSWFTYTKHLIKKAYIFTHIARHHSVLKPSNCFNTKPAIASNKLDIHLIRQTKSDGFTIIEMMVAIFIIAVGILGHVKLQTFSMKTTMDARFSNQVNTALRDLAERLKSMPDMSVAVNNNNGLAIAGSKNFDSNNFNQQGTVSFSENAADFIDCLAINTCTNEQLAIWEINDWYNSVSLTLPLLRFGISTEVPNTMQVNSPEITIDLVWDASMSGKAANDCSSSIITISGNDVNLGYGHQCRQLKISLGNN